MSEETMTQSSWCVDHTTRLVCKPVQFAISQHLHVCQTWTLLTKYR